MKHIGLFKSISLTAKPRIIKASPKPDMAIVWFDIWDLQNSSKAKLLINYSFNFGRYIATIRATNMNLGVPQCHNYWKWDHSTFVMTWLSHYLYFFSFLFLFTTTRWNAGKYHVTLSQRHNGVMEGHRWSQSQ